MTGGHSWRFSKLHFNDVRQDVTEGDQFDTETVELAEALVREATQNSQDARIDGHAGPVRLRFALVNAASGLDATYMQSLLSGLTPHLEASGFRIPQAALDNPSAMIIEDFGTEGLTGEIDDENDEGNFRSFWFTHGYSAKRGSKNGRWGLGKLVYPMSSAGRCLFGLTIRAGESRALLLGEAVHKTHLLNGFRYAPHGHFGNWSDDKIQPISASPDLAAFSAAFGITRRNEPGLSIVVPYPVGEIDREHLLKFVVRNYAYPILTGRLIIDVLGEVVDAENVRRIGADLLPNGLIDFIDAAHGYDDAHLVRIKPRRRGSEERIAEELIEADLKELRERYANGELVGFHVPVLLKRKSGQELESSFQVFFKTSPDAQSPDALFVRGDITVPEEAAQRFRGPGTFALLVARDDTVSEFLADAENPAHTRWAATAARVKENWTYPRQTLAQIRYAPATLHKFLATGQERIHDAALRNFFWIENPSRESQRTRGSGPNRKPGPKPKPPKPSPLPPAMRKVVLQKRKGGFSIKPGPGFIEVVLPATVKVTVCYDVEYGKPKWDRLDFDLADGGIRIAATGAEFEASDNVLFLTVEEPGFEAAVDGFDLRRDLVVDYNLVKAREIVDA
jgi:hypothetical protein